MRVTGRETQEGSHRDGWMAMKEGYVRRQGSLVNASRVPVVVSSRHLRVV